MSLNLLPAFRAANPDAELHYFCHEAFAAHDALGSTIIAAGADKVMDSAHLGPWRAAYDRVVDLVGYPVNRGEGYPEKPMRRHVIDAFEEELGVTVAAPITLPRPLMPMLSALAMDDFGGYVTLQATAGWSPYKNWPGERWAAVVAALPHIPFIQVGAAHEADVAGCARMTGSLQSAIALIANATLHVGVDSFGQHAAHLYGVPSVVLWGSTQITGTGYIGDNVNISRTLHCQPCFREAPAISRLPRGPCVTQNSFGRHSCMADISIQEVVSAIAAQWSRLTREVTA